MTNTIDILITMTTRSSIPWHCHDGHHLWWLSSITNPITTRSSTPKSKTLASTNVKCQPLLAPYNNRLIHIWIIPKKKQKIVNHIHIVHFKWQLWAFQWEPFWRIRQWLGVFLWCDLMLCISNVLLKLDVNNMCGTFKSSPLISSEPPWRASLGQ